MHDSLAIEAGMSDAVGEAVNAEQTNLAITRRERIRSHTVGTVVGAAVPVQC